MKWSILAAAAVLLGATQASGADPIINGSFEQQPITPGSYQLHNPGDTTLTGWTIIAQVAQDGAFFDCCGYTSLTPSDGLDFLDLTGNNDNGSGGVAQTVVVTAGHLYALSFDVGNAVKLGTTGGTSTVNTMIGGLLFSDTNSSQSNALTWQTFTHDFVAPGSSVTIAFSNGDAVGDDLNGLDNVRLVDLSAVPEPSSWALMIVGFGVAGFACRQRRRRGVFAPA